MGLNERSVKNMMVVKAAAVLLDVAEQAVREAGDLVREKIPRPRVLRRKPHGDIVTDGDVFVEDHIVASLRKHVPDYGIKSEESVREHLDAEYVWLLDPIDGTKYYAKGVPLYSISLALVRKAEPILGVVYCPELGRMYCATAGAGATCNGRAIHCSVQENLENAAICLETASRDSPPAEQRRAQQQLGALIACGHRVRILGVASLGLSFCATGGFDAYVNLTPRWKDWDVAAGRVVLQEAGGDFSLVGGGIVAGPATLCEEICALLGI